MSLPLPAIALRVLLALIAVAMVVIGLNTALGGMATLGWQFSPAFMEISDPETFARHDSNARFFAGVYVAFGLCLGASAIWFNRLRVAAIAFVLAITAGGLFRLLQPGYSPLSDAELLPSLIAEIVFMPLLALWLARSP